ncbi:MAG: hypothetical protein ABIT01_13095 [Thermoanaerobaculia bacterium]
MINDNTTNDGSYVPPASGTVGISTLTVPVLVETAAFHSELALANKSLATVTLVLEYVESNTPGAGAGGTAFIILAPKEQKIIAEAIDYLRENGVAVGAKDEASYVGSLRITIYAGTSIDNIFAGARTASLSRPGGSTACSLPASTADKKPQPGPICMV